MRFPRYISAMLLVVLVLLFDSCTHETDELGGVKVTPEMLESVSRSIAEASESEPPVATPMLTTFTNYDTQTILSDVEVSESIETSIPNIVYWTESGTVYHFKQDCGTLRHSQNILEGSIEEAILAKKERACKSCS